MVQGTKLNAFNGIIVDLKDSLATYEAILGAVDTESAVLAKVVELRKVETTYRWLLDTADRDLLDAQDEIEALKARLKQGQGRRNG